MEVFITHDEKRPLHFSNVFSTNNLYNIYNTGQVNYFHTSINKISLMYQMPVIKSSLLSIYSRI